MTKEERLADYKLAKKRLGEDEFCGFCWVLPKILTKEEYPELFAYKPFWVKYIKLVTHVRYINYLYRYPYRQYWFHPKNYKKRIKILDKIIKKMENA